jgi:hypothetical protein
MSSTLAWTKYSPLEDETTLLDPLAFDYFAQVLGNVVLPSFTSRTSRARYYSMVCYGIYISNQYLKKKGKVYYEKDILEAFKLFERYWVRAIVEKYNGNLHERGGQEKELRGKRGALRAYEEDTRLGKIGSLHYHILARQLELGGMGAYRTSLEDLELIKEDLSLTHKGMELAENFVEMRHFDPLVLQAMNEEKIVRKVGKATISSFGLHGSLDGTINPEMKKEFLQAHQNEINLLREYVLDHPKNKVAITFIYHCSGAGDPMEIIKQISVQKAQTAHGEKVVQGFKTILAFEELAVLLNRIWCAIIRTAEANLGKITVEQAVAGCLEYLDALTNGNYIRRFLEQAEYMTVKESYHGDLFAALLNEFADMPKEQYGSFLLSLVKYHISVMKRRNSGPWVILDGGNILVTTGYDYPKKTERLDYLHSYKIPNILMLIEDTGWKTHERY